MGNAIAAFALTKLYPRENLSFGQFTLTEAKYNLLLQRVTALENTLNDTIVALSRLATVAQVHELLVINSTNVEDAINRLEALEERVTAIEEEPLT